MGDTMQEAGEGCINTHTVAFAGFMLKIAVKAATVDAARATRLKAGSRLWLFIHFETNVAV